MLLLALVATAAAGGAVVGGLAQAFPGVQNPGQPLEGANLECMTPLQAAAYLEAHGFTTVVWQIETGAVDAKAAPDPMSAPTSTQQSQAPDHGYVIPGAILGDGQLIMIVDQRDGATGVGACYGMPMP